MLLQAAGLAQLSNKKLALTKAGQKALTTPAYQTIRLIWQKWMKSNLLDEFRRIDNIKGQTGKGQKGFSAVDGRLAYFYTLVSLRTCEEEFARHRQLFLTEQGYSYQIEFVN